MNIKLKIDTYTIYARLFPSIITLLPFFSLWFFVRKYNDFLSLEEYILGIKILGTLTISFIVLYFNSLIIRHISKFFEKKYFLQSKGFPTTYFITFKDEEFSEDFKERYRLKVKQQFNINLLTRDEEIDSPAESKKRINEATKQIILLLKDGYLVKSHNIWYGFSRNMIGGCIIACVISLISIFIGFFISINLIIISIILFLIYLTIFLFRKSILIYSAEAYAKQLISEFMQTDIKKPKRKVKSN